MSQRAATRSAHGGSYLHLLEWLRQGRACITPLCLINIAAGFSVAFATLSAGGSTTHSLAGGVGACVAVAGLFWGAERAGGRVEQSVTRPEATPAGRGGPTLAVVLTALTLLSLGGVALTGIHLGSARELASVPGFPSPHDLDPVARVHRWAAAFALFLVPLSLTVVMVRRLFARAEGRSLLFFARGAR